MPKARPDPVPEEALDPEFARVLRTADPGPALDGPLTFLPPLACSPDVWLQVWTTWCNGMLTETIAPVLAAVARHAERGEIREIQALDLELAAALDDAANARSALAGAHLLRRLSMSRGERWLGKLQRAATAGQTPAHFPVVYAAQSVLFHLPLRLLLPGYAYWEWTAALSACPPVGKPRPRFSALAADLRALADSTFSALVFDAAAPFRAAAAKAS